jgi:GWxTD domain-containing protein
MICLSILKIRSIVFRDFLAVFLFFLTASSLIFFSSSCRLYRMERKLDPMNAEFLSKVRYIITRKERKIFLELPDSEKEAFREEFWKIRDPDPETEENEFKMEYFNRIETADDLFVSEGRPGWLTDRGRIYVLFGPPFERITYPMGSNPESRCSEIWYYGDFPVVFVDSTCTGQYELVTYNLTGLRDLNLMYMHEFSRAQDRAQQTIVEKEKIFFDFNWRLNKNIVDENKAEGIIVIEIPYEVIWFNAEGDMLKTVLDVRLELKDFEGQLIWEYEAAYEVAVKDDELTEKKGVKYKIEIPFVFSEELNRLRLGKNLLHAVIKNTTGNEEAKKVMEFKL